MSWNMEIVVTIGTTILWLVYYRRVIPLRTLNELPSGIMVRSKFGPIYKLWQVFLIVYFRFDEENRNRLLLQMCCAKGDEEICRIHYVIVYMGLISLLM
jgi:hypothetical protein